MSGEIFTFKIKGAVGWCLVIFLLTIFTDHSKNIPHGNNVMAVAV